jgi:hypothetical protein
VGDCLLTSSFLSYCGAFTYDYRDSMVYQLWLDDVTERKLPVSTPFRYCCCCSCCLDAIDTCMQYTPFAAHCSACFKQCQMLIQVSVNVSVIGYGLEYWAADIDRSPWLQARDIADQ